MSGHLTEQPLAMVHKPECAKPDVHALCQCGENVTCRTCGWGHGAYPCKCSKPAVIFNG